MTSLGHVAIFSRADLKFIDEHMDMPIDELADWLGHKPRSVAIARARMLSNEVGDPWTTEDDDFIRATPHLTRGQVAKALGRSVPAVVTRRKLLATREGLSFGGTGVNKDPFAIGGRPLVAKTCNKCGLLLSGSWFHKKPRYHDGQWSGMCKKCVAARHNAYNERTKAHKRRPPGRSEAGKLSSEKLQAITIDRATRAGQIWTDSDTKVLADENLMLVEKALKLGRTYYATSAACTRFGYKSRREGLGDPERDQWIIRLANEVPLRERVGSRSAAV